MGTTIKDSIGFYAMTNDPATTVATGRSKGSNRAFKAIEHMRLTSHDNLKGLIVLIAT